MDWTQDKTAARRTFVMDTDPRYMVESWGTGSWQVWFDGYRISPDDASLGSRDEAQAFAEGHRNSPEQRLARLAELAELVLTEYEALLLGQREAAQAVRWRAQVRELAGVPS